MSQITTHAPGTFSWVELSTTDASAAKKFYASLFGWEPMDTPAGEGMYTLLKLRGREVGGLSGMQKEQLAHGVPPNWLPYLAVTSADDTTKKATALGGTVVVGPFDVMEHGRMSVIQDPTGAAFAIWQAKAHPGATVQDEPGSLAWCELITNDVKAAAKFYTSLFGWTPQDMPMPGFTYTTFSKGETQVAGMMQVQKEWGPVPSHWMTYFLVESCDASTDKAKRAGAEVLKPPADIPNIGRFSMLRDPQGAVFALFQATQG